MNRLALLIVVLAIGCAAVAQQPEYPDAPSNSLQQGLQFSARSRQDSLQQKLPDAPSPQSLTPREKFKIFESDATSPLTFLSTGITASLSTFYGSGYGYGDTSLGFVKNYGAALAEHETSSFLGNFFFPTVLNQDPRYHPSEKDGFMPRATYATTRVFVTRNGAGQPTFNSSYLLGVVTSAIVANVYRAPKNRTVGNTMSDIGSTIGGDAGFNLAKEFWPQVRERVRPLVPKRFRKRDDPYRLALNRDAR